MAFNSPIKDIQTIELIKSLYRKKNQARDLFMFTLAINTGMNLKDILLLNVNNIKNKHYLSIDKNKSFMLNDELIGLAKEVIQDRNLSEPLFISKQGNRLERSAVFRSFKEICTELSIADKYSILSWRKTFGYHYYQKYKDLSYLQWLFNQGNIDLTLKFIDVQENMNLRFREGINL